MNDYSYLLDNSVQLISYHSYHKPINKQKQQIKNKQKRKKEKTSKLDYDGRPTYKHSFIYYSFIDYDWYDTHHIQTKQTTNKQGRMIIAIQSWLIKLLLY